MNKECLRKSAQVCRKAIYEVKWGMSIDVSWYPSGKCLGILPASVLAVLVARSVEIEPSTEL
jgi:hypothetical protein